MADVKNAGGSPAPAPESPREPGAEAPPTPATDQTPPAGASAQPQPVNISCTRGVPRSRHVLEIGPYPLGRVSAFPSFPWPNVTSLRNRHNPHMLVGLAFRRDYVFSSMHYLTQWFFNPAVWNDTHLFAFEQVVLWIQSPSGSQPPCCSQ